MSTIREQCDIGEKVLQLLSKHRGKSDVEKIVTVMTPGKSWGLAELARVSAMNEKDALLHLSRLSGEMHVTHCCDTVHGRSGTTESELIVYVWRRASTNGG